MKGYDCSIGNRKGCNYCLRSKKVPLSNEDYLIHIESENESKILSIDFGNEDVGNMESCQMQINYCPVCGKRL